MGLFDKLFGGKKQQETATKLAEPVDCPHVTLVARWDSVQDMGVEEKATRFMCEACHEEFTPEQARELRANEAKRLAALEASGSDNDSDASGSSSQ